MEPVDELPKTIEPIIHTDISSMSKTANSILLGLIHMNYPVVQIKTSTGDILAEFPEPYLMIFDYYVTMKLGKFKEAMTADTKIMTLTLLPDYTLEQCKFFVEIIPKLFTGELNLGGQQLVWLIKFFDDLLVVPDMVQACFDKIKIYHVDKLKLLNYVIIQVAGKSPGPHMTKLLNLVIDDIQLDSLASDIVGPALFTFAFGRNILTQLIKSPKYSCHNETQLFITLIHRIKDINEKEKDHKMSIKALYDIMACIRWFFVNELEITDTLKIIQLMYPEFKVTKKMQAGFNRRAKLVAGYSESKGTFLFDPKLLYDLDARESYAYSQSTRHSRRLTFYSTTKYPFPIQLTIEFKTKKKTGQSFMVITSNVPKLLIYLDVTTKHGQLIVSQKWNFSAGKPLYIPVTDVNQEYILTLKMAFIPSV